MKYHYLIHLEVLKLVLLINYILSVIFMIWYQKATAYSVITSPSDKYAGFSLGTTLQELLKLAAKAYTIRDDYFIFECSYTQSKNNFNISSTLRTGLASRNTWQILTDNVLNKYGPNDY